MSNLSIRAGRRRGLPTRVSWRARHLRPSSSRRRLRSELTPRRPLTPAGASNCPLTRHLFAKPAPTARLPAPAMHFAGVGIGSPRLSVASIAAAARRCPGVALAEMPLHPAAAKRLADVRLAAMLLHPVAASGLRSRLMQPVVAAASDSGSPDSGSAIDWRNFAPAGLRAHCWRNSCAIVSAPARWCCRAWRCSS
jgi:hypothetical protein